MEFSQLSAFLGVDYTLFLVVCVATIVGMTAGLLGLFVTVRGESLLGDAIAHAALPGILITFLLTETKNPILLVWGGSVSGAFVAFLIPLIVATTPLKRDNVLGVLLSSFFGLGLVIATIIQKYPTARQAALNKFLFGSLATAMPLDVWLAFVIFIFVLTVVFIGWRLFIIDAFDDSLLAIVGYSSYRVTIALTTLVVVTVSVGLQTCGVVLISALMIAPAAAARQWSSSAPIVGCLAVSFGGLSGFLGAYLSSLYEHIPVGPLTIIIATGFVLISLVFSPHRGLLAWLIRGGYVPGFGRNQI